MFARTREDKMINLLLLSNNMKRPSFRQRMGIYLDYLHQNGVHCDVASLPARLWARKKLFQKASAYDAVFLHKKRLNAWDAFWLGRYSRRILYDFDDAVMYNPEHPKWLSLMRQQLFSRTVRLSDGVIAGNEYLADHAHRYNSQVHVIPTGLNVADYLAPSRHFNNDKIRLVWIGSSSTLPYLRYIADALRQISRHYPHVIVRIISDTFLDDSDISLEKVTWSLEGQAQALADCDIGLAPLPDNRLTRGKCGFKILQYQATSLPTVASPVGVNSRIVHDGSDGFLANTQKQWLDKLSVLIENPDQAREMGQAAFLNVKKLYDTSVIGPRLCRLIKTWINHPNTPSCHNERK